MMSTTTFTRISIHQVDVLNRSDFNERFATESVQPDRMLSFGTEWADNAVRAHYAPTAELGFVSEWELPTANLCEME